MNGFEVYDAEEAILLFLEQDQDITLTVARKIKASHFVKVNTSPVNFTLCLARDVVIGSCGLTHTKVTHAEDLTQATLDMYPSGCKVDISSLPHPNRLHFTYRVSM